MALLTFHGDDFEVGEEVLYAVELLKTYGAKEGVRSNHRTAPRVVFDLPGGMQVMVPFNQSELVVVLSDRTVNGASLLDVLAPSMVKSIYPEMNAGTFLLSGKAPSLTPSAQNKVVRVKLTYNELRPVLDMYLGVVAPAVPGTSKPASSPAPVDSHAARERSCQISTASPPLPCPTASPSSDEVMRRAVDQATIAILTLKRVAESTGSLSKEAYTDLNTLGHLASNSTPTKQADSTDTSSTGSLPDPNVSTHGGRLEEQS